MSFSVQLSDPPRVYDLLEFLQEGEGESLKQRRAKEKKVFLRPKRTEWVETLQVDYSIFPILDSLEADMFAIVRLTTDSRSAVHQVDRLLDLIVEAERSFFHASTNPRSSERIRCERKRRLHHVELYAVIREACNEAGDKTPDGCWDALEWYSAKDRAYHHKKMGYLNKKRVERGLWARVLVEEDEEEV